MANSTEKESLSVNDQPISIFLEFADLATFKTVFQGFGVEKFDHLNDVQDDDLLKFGLSNIEIRRFTQKVADFRSQHAIKGVAVENTSSAAGACEPVTKQQSTVLMGPLKPY
ncbi:Hypothetical predicted protein [Paramuricea clavata]|uniref:non-specific protein-tyrosine kinase n=1 Tax=Paramuricea clavata TaxID=317549 RepID=A0A6S7JNJ2_PARCT|nr:Hypothetical predicted protein [Paramuricea clavata]